MQDGPDLDRNGAEPASATIALHLLGGFELRAAARSRQVPPSSQRVLAYLALNERPQLRTQVAGTLWPETNEVRAHASLRTALWRLRRVSPSVIQTPGDRLGLSTSVSVDVREVMRLAHRAKGTSVAEDEKMIRTLLRMGDLLPGWFDDWVLADRERFRQLRLHALESACTQLVGARNFSSAVELGLAAVAAEPLRESAHVALAKAFLAEGNRSEAILDFRRFRELLDGELGICPSATFARLVGERVTPG
jgi:DNA-binding SARP family transcriptional activator